MNDKVYTSFKPPRFTMFIHDPKKAYMRMQPNGLCRLYCYTDLIRTSRQFDPLLKEMVEFSRFIRTERL